jgi:hypothetical protein
MEASKATIYTPEISHNGHRYRLAAITDDSGDQYLEIQCRIGDPGDWYWTRRPGLNCNLLEATILAMLGALAATPEPTPEPVEVADGEWIPRDKYERTVWGIDYTQGRAMPLVEIPDINRKSGPMSKEFAVRDCAEWVAHFGGAFGTFQPGQVTPEPTPEPTSTPE